MVLELRAHRALGLLNWSCMSETTKRPELSWPAMNAAAVFRRILLASVAVTLVVWLGWSLLTPVSLRLVKLALLKWGLLVSVGMALLLCAAWALCNALRLARGFYPVLAGLLAAVVVAVLYWLSPSGLMLPGYGVVIAVVGAALLSMPEIWRRHGGS